eukprot:CAMPEP_0170238878 /NCGR_PEP_ID=MMETSP0116_2-20130129/19196_1 /TAXON_ID=400756 /ORGANISM="Durinskia baltica, Strain CSIRO CS-38" /LENGTH=207 /DNA_ID=CAMNT_0010489695 /DNA_START=65 /DNA_END=688 /DNA_ORIENTATION=+
MTKLATGSPFTLTTLMLRNLPRMAGEWDVVAELREAVPEVSFDFVYVPQGIGGAPRAGFAFVSFSDTAAARAAFARLDGHLWGRATGVSRPVRVKIAHVQGLVQNLRYLKRCEMHKDGFRPPLVFVEGTPISFELALEVFCPEAHARDRAYPSTWRGDVFTEPSFHNVEAAGTVEDPTCDAAGDMCSEASTASSAGDAPVVLMRLSV